MLRDLVLPALSSWSTSNSRRSKPSLRLSLINEIRHDGNRNRWQLLIRHSEIVNGNARLKEELNHLRKERTTANEVHAQFETNIHHLRGEISSLMAKASAINDHREELVKAKEVKRGEIR